MQFYREQIIAVMIPTFLAVYSTITDSKKLEILFIILGGIVAVIFIVRSGEKQLYAELKQRVMGFCFNLKIPFEWKITSVYPFLETKFSYHIFKDELYIIKCLSEVTDKTEYEIRGLIRNNVPDMCILNSKNEVLAIIRFTKLNIMNNRMDTKFIDDTPFLYDTEGKFIGIIREYTYVVDAKGKYKGELVHVLGKFYVVPYTKKGWTANFEPMPNIIFTSTEIENFKTFLPDEMTLQVLPEYKPMIILDVI